MSKLVRVLISFSVGAGAAKGGAVMEKQLWEMGLPELFGALSSQRLVSGLVGRRGFCFLAKVFGGA